ncbi:hypothetical protein BHM03_00016024 [Ensete ventricosum]|nr:hypothetical protein BHM03_00016024 [Ensete ventricosum]
MNTDRACAKTTADKGFSVSSAKMVKGRQGERVRSKSNQYENTSLVQIEGVNTNEEVAWYRGKRMAYIYKAKTKKREPSTGASGVRLLALTATAASSAPSSSPISRQNPW